MRKSVLISLLLIVSLLISILIGYIIGTVRDNNEKKYLAENKLAQVTKEESITTNSAEDVVSPKQEEEKVDNNIKYTLKEYQGCIAVYRLEEGKELVLEDTTDILTKYLSEEDLLQLKDGIVVNGIDELKHLLEDYEQ